MRYLIQSIKENKKASLIVVAVLLVFYVQRALGYLDQRQVMIGTYDLRGEALQLQLSDAGGNGALTGTLQIKEEIYPVVAQQAAPGIVTGHYAAGERDHEFRIADPSQNALLPPRFQIIEFESDGQSFGLLRMGRDYVDLGGDWVSFYGTMTIEPRPGGGWIAALKPKFESRMLVEFQQNGFQLEGAYRQDSERGVFAAEFSGQRKPVITFQKDGVEYRFQRVQDVATNDGGKALPDMEEVFKAFNGVYESEGLRLVIGTRVGVLPEEPDVQHWRCDGAFIEEYDTRPILGCGTEPGGMWLQFRSGTPNDPNFGTAIAYLTDEGIRLTGYGDTRLMKRVSQPIVRGRYTAEDVDLEVLETRGDNVGGTLIFDGTTYRFRGKMIGGAVAAVALEEGGAQLVFTLSQMGDAVNLVAEGGREVIAQRR